MTTTLIRQIIARSGLDAYNEEISAACDAIDVQLSALERQGEPFGYFRAEPFGWTDCEATDEGAIALYEHPAADLTDDQIRLPEPFGYLCDWGDYGGVPRQVVYFGEPGSGVEDDWNEVQKVHHNKPIYSEEQVRAIIAKVKGVGA